MNFTNAGLYDPRYDHDSCGVGLVVDLHSAKTHDTVDKGLKLLENMVHRGAEGADPLTGDGAGIMLHIPHEFILLNGIPVPERGRYGTGLVFLPKDAGRQQRALEAIRQEAEGSGFSLLPVRDVPVNSAILGAGSSATEPAVKQLFLVDKNGKNGLDVRLYALRKAIERKLAREECYIVSLSARDIVYKGMLTSCQLREYFPDLSSPYFTSGIALVHSRFSTNTFPKWELAQPFRYLGHNGEINTIRSNREWMKAREEQLSSASFGCISDVLPVVEEGMSDSASLDNALEFFVMSGMPLPRALAMLIPESWNSKNLIPPSLKAFYEFCSLAFEPWDGPATLLFFDGRYAGGMLDRNGLRPARYVITKSDTLVLASETGVLTFEPSEIREKGKLQPGKILLVDTEKGCIIRDEEVKDALASEHPYEKWLQAYRLELDKITSGRSVTQTLKGYPELLHAFGYTKEEVEKLIIPMCDEEKEPIGSMGNDAPLAALSSRPQLLFRYFRQQFAQVTNPPIDPIREELVMSLTGYIGTFDHNLISPNPDLCKMIRLKSPVLTNREFDILCHIEYKGLRSCTIPMLYDAKAGAEGLKEAIDGIYREADRAVDAGYNYIILSDRGVTAEKAPIPSLLALSALHHHLIDVRKRVQVGLIVESAEPREVMHFALLLGFGASAVNPYMAYAVIDSQIKSGELRLDFATAEKRYIKAIDKGLLKIMSKMGISTMRSYIGAKIFEAVGISEDLSKSYFGGVTSKIGGIDLEDVARQQELLLGQAFAPENDGLLRGEGFYAYRREGEAHAWNPETIAKLQLATRLGSYEKFKEYTAAVDGKSSPIFIRDLLAFGGASGGSATPVPIGEVEPKEAIARRFVTGAMSFGSISREAHEAMAVAMNRLGGKSNTGEGGEDAERFSPRPDGSSARSAIKQVASGRFGVTAEYLVNADEIQIKVAQGAKPGEGGQLPGFKVDEVIAKTRHSIPGISLISPPPHHDIYSIEDLAQLIFDLKNVNPEARISVKLVSESGVGTIAAGVAKAKADMIIISGGEGGTGASPMSSIKYAGLPAEIGLAETQQTLVANNLRSQVALQTDGQLKTGRDIIIAALLGAEEYGFATSALIVLGCVMMRKCHMNTCPVGVATQDERLRARFKGRAEHLLNFFLFLAEEVREHLAQMGFRSLDEIIGRADLLRQDTQKFAANPKVAKVNLSRLLYLPAEAQTTPVRSAKKQEHLIADVLDRQLLAETQEALDSGTPVSLTHSIANTDRAVGAMLSGAVARRYGNVGLPDGAITCCFAGSAGQSFGAFLAAGLTFRLEGDSNDYLGKGLSGGRIVLTPPAGSTFAPEENVIAGNTLLYGATAGEVYINGRVGERFCVRNSGAIAVVEGTGDHCCEYMTGGCAVVLGTVGRNFAAGMSGGVAYVWNREQNFDFFCNMEMVELSLVDETSDRKELKDLLKKHLQYTGSPLAKRMLDSWSETVEQFIKVTPIEYKKILHDRKSEALKAKIASVERDY
ncbi:MAG: glutamate synthase large subunit [Prevotellaceae bacterium]|jgi:glutamate synthase (NADPH/NADH) large chain|nr:glutamate synthase large subunit [Prevotellaceae bacterium]